MYSPRLLFVLFVLTFGVVCGAVADPLAIDVDQYLRGRNTYVGKEVAITGVIEYSGDGRGDLHQEGGIGDLPIDVSSVDSEGREQLRRCAAARGGAAAKILSGCYCSAVGIGSANLFVVRRIIQNPYP